MGFQWYWYYWSQPLSDVKCVCVICSASQLSHLGCRQEGSRSRREANASRRRIRMIDRGWWSHLCGVKRLIYAGCWGFFLGGGVPLSGRSATCDLRAVPQVSVLCLSGRFATCRSAWRRCSADTSSPTIPTGPWPSASCATRSSPATTTSKSTWRTCTGKRRARGSRTAHLRRSACLRHPSSI